ncbi:cyanophycinase [Mongoliitalea daihaiensis]|uniref:cyanophycinase n=1 Tax=Mongoliitalea daihaiensis TaxID=2782006 RepID=UPI001F2DD886|nr:cyanophycinase [Mongoliitalea daihaiensis]UJP66824.1 cyanophycinase [Mongoliitalea daihaiensis]
MGNIIRFVISFFMLCGTAACQSTEHSQEPNPFSLGRVGNKQDVHTTSEGGLVLMGGGSDVDAAMQWMIERSGGGDFLIIRASGGDGYNSYIQNFGSVNSVETLLIRNKNAANDPRVYETIRKAEALFIAGGDQSVYLEAWEGTETERAIHYLIHEKKVPIGGTSAGCAIMGEFVYTGENGSIISTEALSNPFDSRLTVRKSSLINHPLLPNLITDQHFTERGREGRLVSFIARLKSPNQTVALRGIAVDERTALCVASSGDAIVLGSGGVTLLEEHQPEKFPERLQAGQSLHWRLDNQVLRYRRLTQATNEEPVNILQWNIPWSDQFWFVDNGQLRMQ